MAFRVLDTNILVNHWGEKLRSDRNVRPREVTTEQAKLWAAELISIRKTNLILSPVYIEYVCGKTSAAEVASAVAFLDEFRVYDTGRIVPGDWEEAVRLSKRVPRGGGRRQLGDCLIRAVAGRLGLLVITADKRFPD